jgi:hypothetical protein
VFEKTAPFNGGLEGTDMVEVLEIGVETPVLAIVGVGGLSTWLSRAAFYSARRREREDGAICAKHGESDIYSHV